ncbi:tetratricopeptide repeat protein [Rubrivirga litoralis]|uniref:Tetratricopeptide repeat protein n=1 Tax=Rubrivirga litoralis TaxID=3075598 RepID=A0ABU3BUF1_9BACT|nr:tetratricopeptide repeat protein [Rubrivirga sp. F394]MDT0632919.1 tetratricopeptide repeat protein [Rubrivirga sp. F394]
MPLRSLRAPRRPAPPSRPRWFATRWLAAALACGAVATPPAYAQTAGRLVAPDPARAAEAFDEARALFDGALYESSARAFEAFRERYPESPRAAEALYLQAESALASRDGRGAADLFARFETDYPASPFAADARLALGRYYYASGAYDQAEDALQAALARPAPPALEAEAAYLLGQTAIRQGRPAAAEAAFAQAAALDTPTAPAALYALGTTRVEAGDWGGAAAAFEGLRDRYPTAPENAAVRLGLAEAYLRAGRLDEAAAEAEARRPALAGDDAERAALLAGETRVRLGQMDAAEAALAAVPDASRYGRRARLAEGRAAYADGDWQRAADALAAARAGGAALEGAPGGAADAVAHEAAYYQGLALKQLGELADAEAAFAAAEDRPDGAYADAALLELGLLRYERRRYTDAAGAFDRLLAEYPQSPYAGEAARMLGEAYAALGDAARAREAFAQAENLGTASAETRAEVAFQDAYARFRTRDYVGAVPALLAVAEADPAGPRAGEALFWAGEAAFQAGEYARAETILADFLARYPDHRQATAGRYVLAWTHFKRRDYDAAATGFERFLSAYSRSAESVPYYADALLRLGDAYYALGRYDDARQVYARVPAATSERQGGDYALYQTAQAFGSEGQTDSALAAYARLLTKYPQSELYAQALVARGALLAARGDYDPAVADYERVLSERPQDPAAARALLGVADVRLNQERYADAEAAYRTVLDRYPGSPLVTDALDGLAFALGEQGRGGEVDAAVAAAEARVTDPAARARIRLSRAQSSLAAGRDSLAVAQLEGLLQSGPPPEVETDALLALGGAYRAAGDAADAARALRRLLTRFPESALAPEAQLQLADALLASGDAEDARAVAAGFAAAYPADTERVAAALRLEATALDALSRPEEGDDRLRTLVERYPESAAARAVLRARPELAPAPPPVDGEDGGAP